MVTFGIILMIAFALGVVTSIIVGFVERREIKQLTKNGKTMTDGLVLMYKAKRKRRMMMGIVSFVMFWIALAMTIGVSMQEKENDEREISVEVLNYGENS